MGPYSWRLWQAGMWQERIRFGNITSDPMYRTNLPIYSTKRTMKHKTLKGSCPSNVNFSKVGHWLSQPIFNSNLS